MARIEQKKLPSADREMENNVNTLAVSSGKCSGLFAGKNRNIETVY